MSGCLPLSAVHGMLNVEGDRAFECKMQMMQVMELVLGDHDPPPSEQFGDLVRSCLRGSYEVERGKATPVLRLLLPPGEARGTVVAAAGAAGEAVGA